MKLLTGGDSVLAGLILANGFYFAVLLLLYQFILMKFGHDEEQEKTAARAVFYLSAFPLSFFFAAAYTESLFLLLTLATFYACERRAWGWAVAAGALASATRLPGALMFGVVMLEWAAAHGWTLRTLFQAESWRNLWTGIRTETRTFLSIFLIPSGLLFYMLFLQIRFGDPLIFASAHYTLRQHNSPLVLINDILLLLQGELWPSYVMDLFVLFVVAALIVPIWRRFGESYGMYVLLSVLIPISSGVMSFTRYAMVLFPVSILLGMWGQRRVLDLPLRIISLVLLPIFTIMFVKWIFLG
jgi:hypothetical protein